MARTLLFPMFFLLAFGFTSGAAEQPNIVFIFTDDHCEQALSAYDDRRISTPNMDRIAKNGMKFHPLLRDQLDLRAEPGRHSDGKVQPPQRVYPQRQHLQRRPADLSETASESRLPDRRDREMASQVDSAGFRSF